MGDDRGQGWVMVECRCVTDTVQVLVMVDVRCG